jgi:hypothetical protein
MVPGAHEDTHCMNGWQLRRPAKLHAPIRRQATAAFGSKDRSSDFNTIQCSRAHGEGLIPGIDVHELPQQLLVIS